MMLLSDTKLEITNKRVTGSVHIYFFSCIYTGRQPNAHRERQPPKGMYKYSVRLTHRNDFNPFVYFQRVYIGIQQLMSDEKALYNVEMSV